LFGKEYDAARDIPSTIPRWDLSAMNKKRGRWRWRQGERLQQGLLLQMLRAQERGLTTGILLLCIFLLLVGLALQLPSPTSPASPDIFTPVAYSTFIEDIQTGQIIAAHLQGNALNALLVPEHRGNRLPDTAYALSRKMTPISLEQRAFADCFPLDGTGCFDESEQPLFPRTRIIFTYVPVQWLPFLLPLLLNKHVMVTIACVDTPPSWAPLLWKVAPLWVFFLLILGTDTTRLWKW
jgi:hypothetical protein